MTSQYLAVYRLTAKEVGMNFYFTLYGERLHNFTEFINYLNNMKITYTVTPDEFQTASVSVKDKKEARIASAYIWNLYEED